MNCVIIAGGVPGSSDPLFELSRGGPKALIDIAGRPMIAWVAEALINAAQIDAAAIIGLERISGFEGYFDFIPDQGSLVDNVLEGIKWARESTNPEKPLVISSGDIPTITAEIVDEYLSCCLSDNFAVYYPLVPKASMVARYPGANRTYVKLSDLEAAGGDIIVLHPQVIEVNDKLWRALADVRKYPWRFAQIVGLMTMFKYITHRLSLAEASRIGEKIIGRPVKAVITDLAELAMDVDKPHQLELLRDLLG